MKIIKIGAMWCSGCLIMNKVLKKIEQKRNIEIVSLDLDMDEEESLSYNPGDVLPVLIFIDKDKEIKRLIGEHSEEEIINILDGVGD